MKLCITVLKSYFQLFLDFSTKKSLHDKPFTLFFLNYKENIVGKEKIIVTKKQKKGEYFAIHPRYILLF